MVQGVERSGRVRDRDDPHETCERDVEIRLEARIEAQNALKNIIWDKLELALSNANFGKVTGKRAAWSGCEIQVGLCFLS